MPYYHYSYAEKVVFYMKDNQHLQSQFEDLQTTLAINKEMLYSNILSKNPSQTQMINDFLTENNRLSTLLSISQEEKLKLEKKVTSI